jgi:hypothetical protein
MKVFTVKRLIIAAIVALTAISIGFLVNNRAR